MTENEPAGKTTLQEEKMTIKHKWYGPSISGTIWTIGWLFTIGYLQLPFFWKGVLALVIWPYYLGRALVR